MVSKLFDALPVEGEGLNSAESARRKFRPARARGDERRPKRAISTTHHVAVLSRDGIFLLLFFLLLRLLHLRSHGLRDVSVLHCSTLSSTMMASLILVVARDWTLTEGSRE